MDKKTFIRKALSPWVWTNIIIMTVIVLALILTSWNMMDNYTNHGQKSEVPKIKGMNIADATTTLKKQKLQILVVDSIFSRNLPDGMVMEQTPEPRTIVKPGRAIEVKINTHSSPTLTVPDIINNCSRREAELQLTSIGFKLDSAEFVPGHTGYVLGLKSQGKMAKAGDRIKSSAPVTLVIGSGTRNGVVDSTRLGITLPEKTNTPNKNTNKKAAPKKNSNDPESYFEADREAENEIIEEIK